MTVSAAIQGRPVQAARFLGLAVLGSALLAASAQVTVPAWPVPATLQSLVVLLLGAFGGSRLGMAAVATYLAEGMLGMPVFAGGNAGPAALMGPTAGYLLGFLPAAWLAGQARGGLARQSAVLLAAHLVLFVPGVLWLSGFVGARALDAGFLAFLPATIVKVALAIALVRAGSRLRQG